MKDILDLIPWLFACGAAFWAGHQRGQLVEQRKWQKYGKSLHEALLEANKQRDQLHDAMAERVRALSLALGWEYRCAVVDDKDHKKVLRLAGWYPRGAEWKDVAVPPVASLGAGPFLTGFTTSANTGTGVSPSGWWYGLKVFPKGATSGASAPATRATPKAATPKRKRARGSSTAEGRKSKKGSR